ncbi:MAG: ferritin family protein [Clostridium sp.]|uniref:ferritin-like domain-containing protein n=1 Tax=Clostridium sp. TaxID=1506 RepID=UPI002FC9EA7D
MNNGFKVNLPYPEVKVKAKNPTYAKIMLQNYAGMVSEMSAICQYINHEQRIFKEYPEISDTLKHIAMVEMHHLQMIGLLSHELGADLKFWYEKKGKHQWWSPKFIDYEKTVQQMIKANIADEKSAIAQYEKSIAEIDDNYVTAVLKRIILDEQLHIKILTGILDTYF